MWPKDFLLAWIDWALGTFSSIAATLSDRHSTGIQHCFVFHTFMPVYFFQATIKEQDISSSTLQKLSVPLYYTLIPCLASSVTGDIAGD